MKSTVLALMLAAFAFGATAPALATVLTDTQDVIYQQDKCKKGEKWNADTKKCEKEKKKKKN